MLLSGSPFFTTRHTWSNSRQQAWHIHIHPSSFFNVRYKYNSSFQCPSCVRDLSALGKWTQYFTMDTASRLWLNSRYYHNLCPPPVTQIVNNPSSNPPAKGNGREKSAGLSCCDPVIVLFDFNIYFFHPFSALWARIQFIQTISPQHHTHTHTCSVHSLLLSYSDVATMAIVGILDVDMAFTWRMATFLGNGTHLSTSSVLWLGSKPIKLGKLTKINK